MKIRFFTRGISAILVIVMAIGMIVFVPETVSAETWGDYEYTVTGGETTITKYKGSGGAVTIPSEINGYPVTCIGDNAFLDCISLKSVTIPDSVTSIEYQVFRNCTSLTRVMIPTSMTSIGDAAFFGCTSLTHLTIPDSVTSIGNYTFYGCTSLTGVTIPDSVTSIGDYTFYGCTSLMGVTIPDSLTSIGGLAFYECISLTNVTIPDRMTSISYATFYGCTSLTSVTIPDGVTSIGDYAFSGCTSLANVTIGNNVETIGHSVFWYCTSLTSVTIPDSVTNIGHDAFHGCSSLTSVEIGKNVASIGYGAFYNCTSLTGVYISDTAAWSSIDFEDNSGNPLSYAHNLYLDGELVTDLVIPDGVTSIDSYAFYDCTSLKSVTIPGSMRSIGHQAFRNCTSLTSVTIPDSVTSIGLAVFYGCDSLEEIKVNVSDMARWCGSTIGYVLPDVPREIYLDGVPVTELVIPEGVEAVKAGPFFNCINIKSVTIPDSVTDIEYDAFSGCASLEKVNIAVSDLLRWCNTPIGNSLPDVARYILIDGVLVTNLIIPEGVETVEPGVFRNCTSLTSVTIPDSVKTIGSSAFNGCSGLSTLFFGDGLNTVRNGAFKDCSSLEKVYYSGSENDWLRKVFVDDNNEPLRNAEFIFNYKQQELEYVPPKASTSTEEGNIGYWVDPNTGVCYSDAEGKNPIDKDSVIIPKLTDTTAIFTDVKPGKWYTEAVNYVYTYGLMNGMTETTFEPNSPMSRAMLVTVLWRAEGSPEPASATPFTDLKSKWYKNAVAWAYENGVVNGMTATTFGPDASISREQIATIIYRSAEFCGDDVSTRADLSGFPDASKVSKWAKEAVSWAVAEGIISGTKSGNTTILDPKGNATRAQVATILMRYLEK